MILDESVKKNLDVWMESCEKAFEILRKQIVPQLSKERFYPDSGNILRAFRETPYEDLKVIILGQDPYHDGSATGLAFDNSIEQKKLSPSLRNILKELSDDVGISQGTAQKSHLDDLPSQGVLLLNTALTVKPATPTSHAEIWKPFTEQLITDLQSKDNIIWILWGAHAQGHKHLITNETHKFIESTHPSPFSVNKGFFGSKPFSKCNKFLEELQLSPIKW